MDIYQSRESHYYALPGANAYLDNANFAALISLLMKLAQWNLQYLMICLILISNWGQRYVACQIARPFEGLPGIYIYLCVNGRYLTFNILTKTMINQISIMASTNVIGNQHSNILGMRLLAASFETLRSVHSRSKTQRYNRWPLKICSKQHVTRYGNRFNYIWMHTYCCRQSICLQYFLFLVFIFCWCQR